MVTFLQDFIKILKRLEEKQPPYFCKFMNIYWLRIKYELNILLNKNIMSVYLTNIKY